MKSKLNQLKKWMLLPFVVLLFFSCSKNRDDSPVIEKEINLTGFSKIAAGERFNLIVTKGTGFYIKVKGPANSVNDIDINSVNTVLNITYSHFKNNRPKVDVFITLPSLIAINLSGAGTATINGFQGVPNVVRTVLSGASKCTLNGTGINTQIEISGASQLDASGSTESLYGNISGAGKLNSFDLAATEVDIVVSGGSEARVKVVQSLTAEASGGSRVYYKGAPPVKNIQTSGGGQVIQQ